MATNGFDTSELAKYMADLAKTSKSVAKKSKKFLKKEAIKLSKEQKGEIKTLGIGTQGIVEKEVLAKTKAGKVYKYNGDLTCRAYSSHPLAHLLNNGHIHKGGKNHDGAETFVPGYHFIEKTEEAFKSGYYQEIEKLIEDIIEDID
ncbi:HK97 gp10 family phage protein [Clostridium tagluense]|uniref:HK97 gp10 family phage protein n=1 Tax=Clostridium tagluense TaxID=360422 RepID=UPI001C6EF102|nr:HK97 gp10 family phage protein [Clostridium tagluense]MBW9154863.1 HK97 gp10 family phage protein [Clostridium tagluense]WLC64318.1 HK97 gp10 family phage protein [Clostridium tagluense]